jgi:hypothetical protein
VSGTFGLSLAVTYRGKKYIAQPRTKATAKKEKNRKMA